MWKQQAFLKNQPELPLPRRHESIVRDVHQNPILESQESRGGSQQTRQYREQRTLAATRWAQDTGYAFRQLCLSVECEFSAGEFQIEG